MKKMYNFIQLLRLLLIVIIVNALFDSYRNYYIIGTIVMNIKESKRESISIGDTIMLKRKTFSFYSRKIQRKQIFVYDFDWLMCILREEKNQYSYPIYSFGIFFSIFLFSILRIQSLLLG